MASLLVNQSSVDYGIIYYGSGSRMMQTFTMPSGYDTIEYIDLYIKEMGTLPGNFTLELYATSGGLPTGSALRSVSLDSGDIGSSYAWVRFNITDIAVTPGAKYAIVTKQTSTSSTSNGIYWNQDTSNVYSGGASYYSTNSGSSWTALGGDFAFRVYGSQSANPPTVTTGAVSSITTTTADVAGNVTSDGGATVTQRGIVYSSSNSTPTTGDSKVIVAGTTGSYTGSLSGLTKGTHYYARAYAINSQGTSYGSVVEFDTSTTTPTVTSVGSSSISASGATLSGNVTDDGGATVTERGVCWATTSNPTTASSKASSGGGLGSYSVNATGLSPNQLYHFRAYAINANGTVYGADTEFTTLDLIKYWGFSFTPGATGTLTKIKLKVKLASGSNGQLKVRIYANNAGSPGTVLQTISTQVINNSAYADVELSCNVAVTSGTLYWIVVEDPIVVGSYHLYIGSNSAGGYASGSIKYTKASAPSSWINTNHASDDVYFYAYIQPTITSSYELSVEEKRKFK